MFKTAEDGRDFFDYVSGRREPPEGASTGLVHSRFNHPNSEIVEDWLSVYERTENCALFSSGMLGERGVAMSRRIKATPHIGSTFASPYGSL